MFILECAGGEREEESDHIPFALVVVERRKQKEKSRVERNRP
jgi:hypothetical protein